MECMFFNQHLSDRIFAKFICRFRWVALQLMELKKCPTQKAIKEQLNNLPEGLDETYDRILLGISKKHSDYTKTFLLWLCFVIRPMTLEELAATVIVNLAAENGPQFECENKIQDISDVLKMCSSFVIKSRGVFDIPLDGDKH